MNKMNQSNQDEPIPDLRLFVEDPGRAATNTESAIVQLKLNLQDVKSAVWRWLIVLGNVSLATLHEIFQGPMGRENKHLHSFAIGNTLSSTPDDDFPEKGIIADSSITLQQTLEVHQLSSTTATRQRLGTPDRGGWYENHPEHRDTGLYRRSERPPTTRHAQVATLGGR